MICWYNLAGWSPEGTPSERAKAFAASGRHRSVEGYKLSNYLGDIELENWLYFCDRVLRNEYRLQPLQARVLYHRIKAGECVPWHHLVFWDAADETADQR